MTHVTDILKQQKSEVLTFMLTITENNRVKTEWVSWFNMDYQHCCFVSITSEFL
ncbi:hypothetical protein I79_020000 [Cricetulus griseus]|uniref:Uncharacterized protein n=1 Tax=Cricetulus griseus TaxID=10029 RepID=G3I8W8_CRIGR|nr:hypothetical protein I79_020000 [Cricetulus griseus]